MKKIDSEVLVIGGGATGTGIARDLALRGFKTILVDKGDLSTGTTGKYHGLLHSGGRYVVNDPAAALECIQENRILKKIIPFAIEDTGGFFVSTPWDDPDYCESFLKGCHIAKIPVEEIPVSQLFLLEPFLNQKISRCFYVPDASADSFLSSEANRRAAEALGATIFTYHPVTDLLIDKDTVYGAICHDLFNDETIIINSDYVINATGAWAGKITEKAGIRVRMVPGKGTMIALNHRVINTVINRCKLPSDGDIIVPAHTVAVLGTTDHPVPDPEHYKINKWEVDKIISEGEKLIPNLKQMRFLRAWAGVRPLYKESDIQDDREITRAYVLLDHQTRDGISGLITITCGKWTTYRKMAEVTVDLLCKKLHTSRRCVTHLEPLENPEKTRNNFPKYSLSQGFHQLGDRLKKIERVQVSPVVICECELVTKQVVIESIKKGRAKTIDDIRRRTRLGMGPCQGGFCTIRAAGIIHEIIDQTALKTNQIINDFICSRWKGIQPVLWGDQLKQAVFNDFIYNCLFNLQVNPFIDEHVDNTNLINPINKSQVTPSGYGSQLNLKQISKPVTYNKSILSHIYDVTIIGAGLSGLVAAWRLSKKGVKVCVLSKGWGSLSWNSGCIDILSYSTNTAKNHVDSPLELLKQLNNDQNNSEHPYKKVNIEFIEKAINEFKNLCNEHGYPLFGSLEENIVLPGSIGLNRSTCIVPKTMLAGNLKSGDKTIIIGFENYPDFPKKLISDNLKSSGIDSEYLEINVNSFYKNGTLTNRKLNQLFERYNFQEYLITNLKNSFSQINRTSPIKIGLPAIMGTEPSLDLFYQIQKLIGYEVFEIPTLPPSLPGMRLLNILVKEINQNGGKIFMGMKAIAAEANQNKIVNIFTESASGVISHKSERYILATGGVLGGGIFFPYEGEPQEVVLNLPVKIKFNDKQSSLNGKTTRPFAFSAGIQTNHKFQPIDENKNIIFDNVYCVGTGLFGGDYTEERSFDGIGLITGFALGEWIR